MKKFITLLLVIAMLLSFAACGKKYEPIGSLTHYVSADETIWSIAEDINPGKDTRKVVYDIQSLNDWESIPTIQIGQEILIPIYE